MAWFSSRSAALQDKDEKAEAAAARTTESAVAVSLPPHMSSSIIAASGNHCAHCFDSLDAYFRRAAMPPAEFNVAVEVPFFVTLKKKAKHGDYELRGCIGTLSPRSLSHLGAYARKSAFEDGRFDPVAAHELKVMQVGVSLLVNYEPASHPEDWSVGVHGIIIDFTVDGRKYSATYLPEVAEEQGWTQRQALESLVRKAGWSRALPASAWASMQVTRYQSSKAHMSYHEWASMRGVSA